MNTSKQDCYAPWDCRRNPDGSCPECAALETPLIKRHEPAEELGAGWAQAQAQEEQMGGVRDE